jgi:hypothetical protein
MSTLNRPFRLWHGLLAIIAAFAAGSAGSAIAGGERSARVQAAAIPGSAFHYLLNRKTVRANSQSSLTVDCPRGTHATGGGVEGTARFNNAAGQMINSSSPLDDDDGNRAEDDGWFGKMDNFTNAGGEKMKVWVVCVE